MKMRRTLLPLLGLLAWPAALPASVVITPSAGFNITWNGNEGDHFNAADPAPVPANLATAAGAAAFASSDLGPELGLAFHVSSNLNDGRYGNANSWIGGSFTGAPFAGISLGNLHVLSGFAIGRDNGNNVTDVNGGQLTDRSLGLYTVQITRVAAPGSATPDTGSAATGWQTIGTLDYTANVDNTIGEGFTSYFRHQYEITEGGSGVQATGLRLLVPATGVGGGTAIDEIELFGGVVPEPATAAMALLSLGGLALRRRRA